MKRTGKPSKLTDPKNITAITVHVNLEARDKAGYKSTHDELVFNLKEESVDDILAKLAPILKRGDLESCFISIDRDLMSQDDWDSLGQAREWEFKPY